METQTDVDVWVTVCLLGRRNIFERIEGWFVSDFIGNGGCWREWMRRTSWRAFFVATHPIREQVLLFLHWPHQVDTWSAAVVQYWREGRRTEGWNSHANHHTRVLWHFFSLYVTITSPSDGKNRIFTVPGGWNNFSYHHRYNHTDGTSQGCLWWCLNVHWFTFSAHEN